MLILFGCSLFHCSYCRMQFRDWRKLSRTPLPVRTPPGQRSQFAD
jgi:hypothetical protein